MWKHNLYAAMLTDAPAKLGREGNVKSMTKTFSSSDKGHKVAEINLA